MSRPILSPPPDYQGPQRSLVLSGGGMRLSYQAGVIKALLEHGLCFQHMDGTSGGSLNLAMILAGLSAEEIWKRWASQDPKAFVSLMPAREYLDAGNLTAMGGADGVRQKVLPHLGIDFDKINRADGVEGTFNVCNYARKTNEVIAHSDIDIDLLVAGMSLPGVMPPVTRGTETYIDSAFIQDANLMEAVRRGSKEIWLIWCMGNSAQYRGGLLNIYVQMLEMSANGALNTELERIREANERLAGTGSADGDAEPVIVHIIRPQYPLPLDSDLYLDKIDHQTLMEMGYSDARRYLGQVQAEGVPLQPESIQMQTEGRGFRFSESLYGKLKIDSTNTEFAQSGGPLSMSLDVTVAVHDYEAFQTGNHQVAELTGSVGIPQSSIATPIYGGQFRLLPAEADRARMLSYELLFDHRGQTYCLSGEKRFRDDPGPDLWQDATSVHVQLHIGDNPQAPVVGSGTLRLGPDDVLGLVRSIAVTNVTGKSELRRSMAAVGRMLMGDAWSPRLDRLLDS